MSENGERDATTGAPAPVPVRLGRMRLGIALAGAIVGGLIGGAGGLAVAAGGPWQGGFDHGPRLERIQGMVTHALDAVGATSAQESKIHDIVATTAAGMMQDGTDRMAMRTQMLDILRAPTVDRAAVEKLRADQVARFDAKSKAFVGAVLDAADQLTPAQRTALADRAEQMMARHRGGGEGDGSWHHRGDGEPDGPHPDQGPGNPPDKG